MEVDNLNVRENSKKKDRSKIRCYNCQKLGHHSSECQKPKKKISSQEPHSRHATSEVHEESTTHDDVAMSRTSPSDILRLQAAKQSLGLSVKRSEEKINVMIDSGATTSLCRVVMGSCVVREMTVRIAGYDNVVSDPTRTREVTETLVMYNMRFDNVTMTKGT
ncbi:hypothetical protein H310_14953 [Aphanomyces invadans]|uniref:CCHC-type domain-containing protein n=1 Tax=Aphanomyces invadans TaxID=157072 RepID=A0A024T8C6_9STRA|nr:hypothetical protein H310_14953 [Aphanomyces invadans]ETV90209.1 hypothetical protein H310_14953 [Aphanomyces invadans]|eukprot:XP_008881155.1 hypothetical protein H310_14953 [Aphanomyces invadans]